MKIVIYTYYMHEGTERLMPWRTLIEVAKVSSRNKDINISILSSSEIEKTKERKYQTVDVVEIPKGKKHFLKYCLENEIDVIYYPVSWRDGLKSMKFLDKLKFTKIAYITGGVYPFSGVLSLIRTTSFSISKSYVLECFTPKFFITKKLKKAGFSKIITFSYLTGEYAKQSGWSENEVTVSLPGQDSFAKIESNTLLLNRHKLNNKKFYLFMGAPAEARGSLQLLKAFDKYAEKNKEALLVFLMRTDNHSNYSSFERVLKSTKNRKQILVLKDKLSPADLKAYVETARAVILPFLVIPSEIPLTYFEVLSCGTPIITYKNGGTYDYVQNAVLACKPGSEKGLTKMMEILWNDDDLHQDLSEAAINLMEDHPKWEQIGEEWISVI